MWARWAGLREQLTSDDLAGDVLGKGENACFWAGVRIDQA
jgi:hypothetical protein